MKKRKGFTLIELMVVIFIVGILAAVAIPIMRGRIDSAKWSEGRAAAGSIRTAARAFCAEKGPNWGGVWANVGLYELGFTNLVNLADGDDLDGKYFTNECTVEAVLSQRADKPTSPAIVTLDQDGVWTP
ncbi:MAG: type IV pilin protein [Planctomycetota bacterium]|jgi:prepilin-type N-terminal cleavage/methylation domain-containing protein